MHIDELAVVKKIECVHYKTKNGEFDFYSRLELKWQLPIVTIWNQELG